MFRKKLILLLSILNSISPTKSDDKNCVWYHPIITKVKNPLALIFKNQTHAILAEHHGIISGINLSTKSTKTILNLSDEIFYINSLSEVGLLGLAIDHRKNQSIDWIYVSISRKPISNLTGINHQNVVKRYKFDFNNFKVLSDEGGEEIFVVNQPSESNNGGHLFFDGDGGLFMTIGDGGLNEDEGLRDDSSHLGKIIRIDTKNHYKNETYASGFENPWRCSYGQINNRIFCGDVGKNGVEKIWLIEKNKYKNKIYEHKVGNKSVVIGGFYYVGRELPFLKNRYLFGDYIHGSLHSLKEDNNSLWHSVDVTICEKCRLKHRILAFAEDDVGNIYVLTSTRDEKGVVYKLVDSYFNSGLNSDAFVVNFPLITTIFIFMLQFVV